jgi:hypothetical protein
MKLKATKIDAQATEAWGKQAFVVPYRIAGNRRAYALTDHGDHWLPLETSWNGGGQVFEPVGTNWPWDVRDVWVNAVMEAAQLALAYFTEEGNRAAVERLPRGQVIAEGRYWRRIGDKFDTWLIPSQKSKMGLVYLVNGLCTCSDPVPWCKHRLGRALAKRATQLLKNENGAGDESNNPAPASGDAFANSQPHSSTAPTNGQAQRINLIVAYEADDAPVLPHTDAHGQLVQFDLDGCPTEPPTRSMASASAARPTSSPRTRTQRCLCSTAGGAPSSSRRQDDDPVRLCRCRGPLSL